MSSPLVPYTPGTVAGDVVQPTAVASSRESAAFALAQVLKDLIHGTPQAFHGENLRNKALEAVDKFTRAFVSGDGLRALVTGDERAPLEDVSKRTPPPQVTFGTPVQSPGIDYDRLAAAIVRQQQAAAQQAALDAEEDAKHPPVAVVEDNPA